MSFEQETYDLICSLGGNCAAAHNLRYRNLRHYALPFDWTYFTNDKAIYVLADGFKNNFKNYMLRENLKELPVNQAHADKVQYEDTFANIIWANHFSKSIADDNNLYEIVKKKFDKRFRRLVDLVSKSAKILFLFSTNYAVDVNSINYLYSELTKIYPQKSFRIVVLSFNAEKDEEIITGDIELYRFSRNLNLYDFTKTNYEWHFLDFVKVKNIPKKKISLFERLFIMLCPIKKFRRELRKSFMR